MLAERPATDLAADHPRLVVDRSMLVLQYALAVIALLAALLLTGVR
jgi:hypothetical protein